MNTVLPITAAVVDAFVPGMDARARADLDRLGGPDVIKDVAARSVYTFAGLTDGAPLFIGGLQPAGHVWMLGGDGIARAKKFYLRATRGAVDHMMDLAPILWTMVDDTYPRSLRWLEWLGFTVHPANPIGGRMVHYVELKR